MTELLRAAEEALGVAREAARVVMRVYAAPFEVEYKVEDDPVTRADRESNALVCERLERAFPGVPIVAEESDPQTYAGFERADAAWFVDPLDGTRDFVRRNGEFAVMIGLAERGRAVLGVIVAPAWDRAFVGVVGQGAWEIAADGSRAPVRVSSRASLRDASIVVSRSHAPAMLPAIVAAAGARQAVGHGSSGLKGVLIAIGEHDVYFQPGPAGMRWDACATEGLVRGAGGDCTEADGSPFDYASPDIVNRGGILATNGLLHGPMIEALREARSDAPP